MATRKPRPAPKKIKLDFLRRKLEVRSLDDSGAFRGYAAVFDSPATDGSVIELGAFADTIAEWEARGVWPRVKWKHDDVIGHVTSLVEDDYGLLVTGQIWDPAVAAELRDAVQNGEEIGMSFAFYPAEGGETMEISTGLPGEQVAVRRLTQLILDDDVTLTTDPVQTEAQVVEVRSGDAVTASPRPSMLEGCLRDAGCSRQAAKKILAGGLPALRDAGPGAIVLAGLREIRDLLRG